MSEELGLDVCLAASSWGTIYTWARGTRTTGGTSGTDGTRLMRLGTFRRAGVDGDFLAGVVPALTVRAPLVLDADNCP